MKLVVLALLISSSKFKKRNNKRNNEGKKCMVEQQLSSVYPRILYTWQENGTLLPLNFMNIIFWFYSENEREIKLTQ